MKHKKWKMHKPDTSQNILSSCVETFAYVVLHGGFGVSNKPQQIITLSLPFYQLSPHLKLFDIFNISSQNQHASTSLTTIETKTASYITSLPLRLTYHKLL